MSKQAARQAKIKAEEAQILAAIEERGPMHTHAIGSALGMEMPTMHRALKRLIRAGLIARIGISGRYAVWDSADRAQPDRGYQAAPGVRVVRCGDHAHPKPFIGLNAPRITGWGQSSLAQ